MTNEAQQWLRDKHAREGCACDDDGTMCWMASLLAEFDQLREALQRIATYEVPGTGVYRNTDAAEYARRVLDGDTQ